MTVFTLVRRNLMRKKARLLLTFGSIAATLFLFGLLATIELAFGMGVSVAGVDRLVIRNRTSLIMPLPLSYKERLLRVSHIETVSHATWFGGIYQDERNFFPQFAVEPESWREVYGEYRISEEQWRAFMTDREAAAVGRQTADRFGWKVGDRIPLRGTIWTGTWEFNIRAIYEGSRPDDDTSAFWFHYELLDERRPWGKGSVGWYVAQVDHPDNAEAAAREIDELFANSPAETTTETEQAMAIGFARQVGNISFIITSIGAVVFFTLLLVTANTMAMAVRERTSELGVLKAVGFSDRAVMLMVLAESMLLAVAGGAAGLLLAKVFTLRGDPTGGLLPLFYLAPARMAQGLLLAAAIGVLAGVAPALGAMRLRVVDAMRRA